MRNNFRIILLIITPVIVLAFAFFISNTHSKMLSSHWATLECTNDKKSTTASKKITLGSRYLTQLRRDWIKNEMWRFMTALDNKGRFLSWKLNEEVDRYFSWEYTTNNNILYELSRENITFKITFFDKSPDVITLKKVIKLCFLEELLERDRKDIKTISETGKGLSGGQLQKIAIARALYVNPELLILDESTNSLDAETEKRIFENLAMTDNLKVLIISHHMQTLEYCDTILQLSDNNLVKIK